MDAKLSIRSFQKSDLEELDILIKEYWYSDHIFLHSRKLLEWQYKGYGLKRGFHFPLLLFENEMIGCKGIIPSELRIPVDNTIKIEPLAVGALFLVKPKFRGQKLGLLLHQYAKKKYSNFLSIAANLKTSAPIYRKSGYFIMDEMLRYILPLNDDYANLLITSCDDYRPYIFESNCDVENPLNFTSTEMSDFYLKSIGEKMILSMNKSREFWQWRYLDNPVYKYQFFGGKGKGGLIVARVCKLYNDKKLRDETILRILELLPENPDVWDGIRDIKLNQLLKGVFKWAQQKKCAGVDFYSTTHCFAPTLESIGMKEINEQSEYKNLDIFSYFEPTTTNKRLCNVCISLSDSKLNVDFDKTYFTLADSDQDRPNILSNE